MTASEQLAALDRAATQELLADEGHYFADTLCDLASCSHGETAHFNHQGDGPFIAALWNLYRAGRIAVIDDEAEAENAKLREALGKAIDFLKTAPLESGYCCCGSAVKDHGMGDGHSPVDDLAYWAASLQEQLEQALETDNG